MTNAAVVGVIALFLSSLGSVTPSAVPLASFAFNSVQNGGADLVVLAPPTLTRFEQEDCGPL